MAGGSIRHFFIARPMYVHSFKIHTFRNFEKAEVACHNGVNIFFGRNASGKTSLLEALFLMCLGRSQRGAPDSVLVRDGDDSYRVEGKIERDERISEVAVAYQKNMRKQVSIEKLPVRTSELYGQFAAVSTGPEDTEMISGAPSVRRTVLDLYLSQLSRKYLSSLTDYQRAMAQKNAALKMEQDPGAFNLLLADYGATVMKFRAQFLRDIAGDVTRLYSDISGGSSLSIEYDPSVSDVDCSDHDSIRARFERRLEELAQREMIVGSSLVGPHRDDIKLLIGGYPARTHASQGEWRTAAVSFKLAVYHQLRKRASTEPILLLDEIFAELDDRRTEGLISAFGEFGQLFLTTASTPPDALMDRARRFQISAGSIEPVA